MGDPHISWRLPGHCPVICRRVHLSPIACLIVRPVRPSADTRCWYRDPLPSIGYRQAYIGRHLLNLRRERREVKDGLHWREGRHVHRLQRVSCEPNPIQPGQPGQIRSHQVRAASRHGQIRSEWQISQCPVSPGVIRTARPA